MYLLPERRSGLALVGETCHSEGGGELPDWLRRRVDGGVPIDPKGTCRQTTPHINITLLVIYIALVNTSRSIVRNRSIYRPCTTLIEKVNSGILLQGKGVLPIKHVTTKSTKQWRIISILLNYGHICLSGMCETWKGNWRRYSQKAAIVSRCWPCSGWSAHRWAASEGCYC